MKKYLAWLTIALAGSVAAQQATPPSSTKPSAQVSQTASHHEILGAADVDKALPVGTAIRMKLETPLHTDLNSRGDRFGGRVTQAVILNGRTIIPVGSALEGQVIRAESARRIKGKATIDLLPDTVTLPNGQRYKISATIVDTSDHSLDVNEEGAIKGQGRDRRDWIEMGAASAAGAGIGAAIGGGKGALIGTGIGASASVVRWLTRTKSTALPVGTELIMELSRPLQLSEAEGD
jgi:hypothetical protein